MTHTARRERVQKEIMLKEVKNARSSEQSACVVSTGERLDNKTWNKHQHDSSPKAHTKTRGKAYKANRATVTASYFAKSISKVNNTSVRSVGRFFYLCEFSLLFTFLCFPLENNKLVKKKKNFVQTKLKRKWKSKVIVVAKRIN